MMKYYTVYYEVWNKGHLVNKDYSFILADKEPTNKEVRLTWDNVLEIYQMYALVLGFNIWNAKKGLVVSFFTDKFFPEPYEKSIKQWKESLDITFKIKYKEETPTLERIIKYHDGDKAIQYLKDRGITLKI